MNETERCILVKQQVGKAQKFLVQADEMMRQHLWDLAVNRFYYACFQAVQGLFISQGINAHTHTGVVAQFSLHYVKTSLVEPKYGSFIARLMQLRQKADYNCAYDVTELDAKDIVVLSHNFVDKVVLLIQGA